MGFLERTREFFRDVLGEFKRVSWPSRAEVLNSTVVVLVLVFILAFFLWAVDVALSWPVERLLKWGGRA